MTLSRALHWRPAVAEWEQPAPFIRPPNCADGGERLHATLPDDFPRSAPVQWRHGPPRFRDRGILRAEAVTILADPMYGPPRPGADGANFLTW